MTIDYKVPWERYGMIAYLAHAMQSYDVQFGKTSMQKIMYILQEIYNVKTGYSYTLYNYGPYSAELANDLNYVAALKGVEVSWINTGGYSITPDIATKTFYEKSRCFIENNKNKVQKALDYFGGLSAKELELKATIIYFFKQNSTQSAQCVAEQIHQLKPYFSKEAIQEAIDELKNDKIV